MAKVKIYIETSQGGKIRHGVYAYMLECLLKNGDPYTKEGHGELSDTTKDRLTLQAMIDALGRVTDKAADILFVTSNKSVLHTVENGWHLRWQKNGWKGTKGLVNNADLWQRYAAAAEGRSIYITDTHNSYGTLMREYIRKAKGESNADD